MSIFQRIMRWFSGVPNPRVKGKLDQLREEIVRSQEEETLRRI